jgi:hypothetical protein
MLAASACLFTRDEADAFLDVAVNNLLTYANNMRTAG